MSKITSKFHTTNFQGTINVNMNVPMAQEMYDLIKATMEEGRLPISPALFTFSEKLKTQFFHMRVLPDVLAPSDEVTRQEMAQIQEG